MGSIVRAADVAVDSDQFDRAVRFRDKVGLATDRSTIEQSLTQTVRYPNHEFGVPLTDAEAAEVERIAKVGQDIDAAALWAEAHAPAYAGSWIDHSRGSIAVFMIKGSDAATIEGIRARLSGSLQVEFVDVRYSLAELDALQDRINGLRDNLQTSGIPLASTGIHPPSNTVEIGVVSPTQSHIERLRNLFGDAISIYGDTPTGHADACPQTDCLPPKAGIGIYSTQAGSGNNPCTLGWGVRVTTGSDYFAAVTAGHCFRVVNFGEGIDWNHPIAGTDAKIGDAEKQTWYTGADADVGLIDYSPTSRLTGTTSGPTLEHTA